MSRVPPKAQFDGEIGKAVSVPTSSLGPRLRIPSTSPVEPLAASQFNTYKMVVYYQIAGKKVGSHVHLRRFVGCYERWREAQDRSGPPINASSKDEENFIQNFMKEVDGGEKKPNQH
ncbi:uncharacterized protein N7446_002856 [Penicillium canescens]|uniref:uncharacterized protein n=1 Tax=Penicillium canescens TaxID=5083 RepID=UPI0026DF148A|nr:uncharacterized protein N7446_002856 [Penicillium canescens]KAJ6075079.1 hypothetical protein N7446_002856 [Penicillium canescens]